MCIVFVSSLPAFRSEGECRHADHRCLLSVCFHIHPEVMESALSVDMLAQMCLVCIQIHPEVMESAMSADMLTSDVSCLVSDSP